jgi:hypothetical protein
MRGLPDFEQVLRRPDNNRSLDTRQMDAPRNLRKIEILAFDQVFNTGVSKLLLNPTSITEQKSANWIRQYIPGQSDPLLQWANGSERVVSFTAFVTKDTANTKTLQYSNDVEEPIVVREIGSGTGNLELTGSSIPVHEGRILNGLPKGQTSPLAPTGEVSKFLPLSIQNHLDYYRSLLMPRKSSRKGILKTPPLVTLRMGSLLGNERVMEDAKWILISYNIEITKQTPDLTPIEAQVQFTFIEYVDRSKSVDVEAFQEGIFKDATNANNITISPVPTNTDGIVDSVRQRLV